MDKYEYEVNELKEKIEFCSLFIKYAGLVEGTMQQSAKAFKLKNDYEEELNVLKLQNNGK